MTAEETETQIALHEGEEATDSGNLGSAVSFLTLAPSLLLSTEGALAPSLSRSRGRAARGDSRAERREGAGGGGPSARFPRFFLFLTS